MILGIGNMKHSLSRHFFNRQANNRLLYAVLNQWIQVQVRMLGILAPSSRG
jgi:hypothetical protein